MTQQNSCTDTVWYGILYNLTSSLLLCKLQHNPRHNPINGPKMKWYGIKYVSGHMFCCVTLRQNGEFLVKGRATPIVHQHDEWKWCRFEAINCVILRRSRVTVHALATDSRWNLWWYWLYLFDCNYTPTVPAEVDRMPTQQLTEIKHTSNTVMAMQLSYNFDTDINTSLYPVDIHTSKDVFIQSLKPVSLYEIYIATIGVNHTWLVQQSSKH